MPSITWKDLNKKIKDEDTESIKEIITEGYDNSSWKRNIGQNHPILVAMKHRNRDLTKLLIEKAIRLDLAEISEDNAKCSYNAATTALKEAIALGWEDVAILLFKRGEVDEVDAIRLNAIFHEQFQDYEIYTALDFATKKKQTAVVDLLKKSGAQSIYIVKASKSGELKVPKMCVGCGGPNTDKVTYIAAYASTPNLSMNVTGNFNICNECDSDPTKSSIRGNIGCVAIYAEINMLSETVIARFTNYDVAQEFNKLNDGSFYAGPSGEVAPEEPLTAGGCAKSFILLAVIASIGVALISWLVD